MLEAVVIGCGKAASLHTPCLLERPDCHIVAVCDPNPAKAASLCSDFGISNHYVDPERAFSNHKPDFVVICSPPQAHCEGVRLACEFGADVILEKPIASTHQEAKEIYSMAESAGIKLGVVHNYLFAHGTKALLSAISDELIGRPVAFTKTWATTPSERMLSSPHWSWNLPGGRWTEAMPHHLYVATRICGHLDLRTVHVSSIGNTPGLPANRISIDLAGASAPSRIDLVLSRDTRYGVMTTMGTEGMVVATFDEAWIRGWESSDSFKTMCPAERVALCIEHPHVKSGHKEYLDQFLDWLNGEGSCPSTKHEALETMRLTYEIGRRIEEQCATDHPPERAVS